MAWRALTAAQWERIRPHLPREKRPSKGGRPRADPRRCFEGILWVLWTGAPWSELPPRYGSPTTCWRRLRHWEESGVLLALWRALLNELNDRQKLRRNECFIDRSFAPATKGGAKIGPTKRGKGTKWMVLVDGAGTPQGAYLDAASPAEVTLLEKTLASQPIRGKPERLIADRGYDSNAVRRFLKQRHIQPIIPARSNNTQATDPGRRCLRRYRRRLTARYDRLLATYGGFFPSPTPPQPPPDVTHARWPAGRPLMVFSGFSQIAGDCR